MGAEIFISICIPAYQRPDNLKRLLDSIFIQSYRHFEVIITDDSPGGEVRDQVQRHALVPMIRYFKNSQALGTPENWNESVRKASGDWIKIMHDDDWFSSAESLGSFARAIGAGGADFYFSAYTNVYSGGNYKIIRNAGRNIRRLNRNPEILLGSNRIGPPSAVIYKKDPQLSFDARMRWLVDMDFYLRYLKQHRRAVYIGEPLVSIGISDTQVTQTSFGNRYVEIPERFMVWEKADPLSIRNIWVYDSWWRFIRNMQIKNPQEIAGAGFKGTIPDFVTKMIRRQKPIPRFLIKIPLISKLLMSINYLVTKVTGN